MALARSLPRDSLARCSRSQISRSATKGALDSCRTARRRSALWPLIERSMSNRASMRRTASSASGEITAVVLPCALRRAFAVISARAKNGRLAWAQQPAAAIGPGLRSTSYSLL